MSGNGVIAATVTESPVLRAAIVDYNAKNYKLALQKLATLPKSGPGSDKMHYYTALCYQMTNQIKLAVSEYTIVYQTSRDQGLRYNASVALNSLQRWSARRQYAGNGNNFSRESTGGRGGGGGGGGCGPSG